MTENSQKLTHQCTSFTVHFSQTFISVS